MNLHIFKMSQLYYSACSRCFIFYVIISVLICHVMARHRFNHNHLLREQEMRQKSLENVKKEAAKILRLFLRPPSIARHGDKSLDRWSQSQEQEVTLPNNDTIIDTSCGRINCENITDYPFKLIEDLFAQNSEIQSQEIIPESEDEDYDETVNSDDIRRSQISGIARSMGRSQDSSWLNPNEYNPDDIDMGIPSTKYECELLAAAHRAEQSGKYLKATHRKKGNICEYKVRVTTPQETIDTRMERFTLVNDNASIIIKSYECVEEVDCEDPSISINYVYHCSTNWRFHYFCGLNKAETAIVRKKVAVGDGCICKPQMRTGNDAPVQVISKRKVRK